MDLFEIEQKETLTRKEVATRLRRLAKLISDDGDLEFERDGMKLKLNIPEQVELKLELEVGTDKREIEIELTW